MAASVDTPRALLVAGTRGSGKTSYLIDHVRRLLRDGAPARRILVVTFSPRGAARFAARLPGEVDGEPSGGVWLQTAQRLCAWLLYDCSRGTGTKPPTILSALERAMLLREAAARAATDLGSDHPLTPALTGGPGLAEIDLLLGAIAGQGGLPINLQRVVDDLAGAVAPRDRAVLDGIARVYRSFADLCKRAGAITYQEVAPLVAAMLSDMAIAGPIASRIDHLIVDDLDRAEPAQLEALARIGARARLVATVDPCGPHPPTPSLVRGRGGAVVDLIRDAWGLDLEAPSIVLTPPRVTAPALARARAWLGDGPHPPTPSLVRGRGGAVADLDRGGKAENANRTGEAENADRTGEAENADRTGGTPTSDQETGLVIVEEALDTDEVAYIVRHVHQTLDAPHPLPLARALDAPHPLPLARARLDRDRPQPVGGQSAERSWERGSGGEGFPAALVLAPASRVRRAILAALRREGLEPVDAAGDEVSYNPAVRYALAWLRTIVYPSEETWERVLTSPHASIPVAELALLRHWAAHKDLTLEGALWQAARGGCDPLGDAARARLTAIATLLRDLRDAAHSAEAPSVILHRLLAREELIGAALVGPTDPGAATSDPAGIAALYAAVERREDLWQRVHGEHPGLTTILDGLEVSAGRPGEGVDGVPTGRVVVAGLDAATDWRADTVLVAGLAAAHLPRPRPVPALLPPTLLPYLAAHWTLPWPADLPEHVRAERRALALAIAAGRDQAILTRALRYGGEEAAAPSPLLIDLLGATTIDRETCHSAGVRFDHRRATHEDAEPREAARDLETLLYNHARTLAARDRAAAEGFVAGARAVLADAGATLRGRYLGLEDPFAPLPATDDALPLGSRLSVHDLQDFLSCPRRFFYGALAGLRPPANARLSYGMLVSRAAQALHRMHPSSDAVTLDDAEEVLRLLWEGAGDAQETGGGETEGFAGRFGPRLQAEATRTLARGVLRRLAGARGSGRHPQFARRMLSTGVRVELPVPLPDGRTVRVAATVDAIAERPRPDGTTTLSLIDYRSGGSRESEAGLIGAFVNRDDDPAWRPRDYTLPVMFLGVAGNRAVYREQALPRRPVRELSVVSLGRERDGVPLYRNIGIVAHGSGGRDTVTVDELRAAREGLTATVIAAAAGPHRPASVEAFRPCEGCPHRFACPGPGPETVE